MDKVDKYLTEYVPYEGPTWTVVRVWRNVEAKSATDAILASKGTPHDEVNAVKSGQPIKVKK